MWNDIIGRMRTPVREAFSYGIRHVIRHVHCDLMSYDQIRVKPYRGVAKCGIWYLAECILWNAKISCKSLQKSDWSYGNERKNVSHKSHSVYLIKSVNKRGERSSQSYDNFNVSPYGTCYHSFVCAAVAYEIKDVDCRTGEHTAYDTRLWGMSIASCRMNHTLVRHYAGRTKLN